MYTKHRNIHTAHIWDIRIIQSLYGGLYATEVQARIFSTEQNVTLFQLCKPPTLIYQAYILLLCIIWGSQVGL